VTIRVKLALLTSGLIGAVVVSVALAVSSAQRSALEEQSGRRLKALADSAGQMAQESIKNRDRLMLLGYLMHLQKEHGELAFASVGGEHTSTIGASRPGLAYWTGDIDARREIAFTASKTLPAPRQFTGDAFTREDSLVLTLGFDMSLLDAEISNALKPLTRKTVAIALAFMVLGWLGALRIAKLMTAPMRALATAVSAVKAGNLDVLVAGGGSDEVGVLASRFNEMTAHLKELTQFREDLLHTLTHELNTPLGGLKGYLELWRDDKIPDDPASRDEVLQTMTAAVMRMEQSLGNALGLFRAGAQGGKASKRSVWMSDLLREACTLFTPEASVKNITFVLPPDNERAFVHANPELLHQIVVNLISNAVKYTSERGQIRLTVEADKEEVRLGVSDDGVGIPPEDLPHLFTKFYSGAETDVEGRRRIKGTGLGLGIAQRAALTLGGSISVSSKPGRGSTFTVTLPKFAPIAKFATKVAQ